MKRLAQAHSAGKGLSSGLAQSARPLTNGSTQLHRTREREPSHGSSERWLWRETARFTVRLCRLPALLSWQDASTFLCLLCKGRVTTAPTCRGGRVITGAKRHLLQCCGSIKQVSNLPQIPKYRHRVLTMSLPLASPFLPSFPSFRDFCQAHAQS